MILLALDQSSITTGYAVFNDNTLINYGKFTVEGSIIGDRLMKIKIKIKELIDSYNPEIIIFEDIQLQDNVQNNVQTFKVLAHVQGILHEMFTQLKIPYKCILSGTWKSSLNIKGQTRKEQKKNAQKYVEDNYNIIASEDIADAICLGTSYNLTQKTAWD